MRKVSLKRKKDDCKSFSASEICIRKKFRFQVSFSQTSYDDDDEQQQQQQLPLRVCESRLRCCCGPERQETEDRAVEASNQWLEGIDLVVEVPEPDITRLADRRVSLEIDGVDKPAAVAEMIARVLFV